MYLDTSTKFYEIFKTQMNVYIFITVDYQAAPHNYHLVHFCFTNFRTQQMRNYFMKNNLKIRRKKVILSKKEYKLTI